MISMIPGARSAGAATHDQKNTETPRQAIIDGADLLVIGRQITEAPHPVIEFANVYAEVQTGIET